jgi:hypothetical protein
MIEPPFSVGEPPFPVGEEVCHRKVSSVFTLEGEDLVWTSTDK